MRARRADISLAYELLLQRAPDLEALTKADEVSLFELVDYILLSEEFAQKVDQLAVRAFPGAARVFHIHIPKTAGSSLHAALQSIGWATYKFDLSKSSPPERSVCYETFTLDRLRKGMLIGGHRPLDAYGPMHKPGDRYVSFIREPLQQILSYYNYLMMRIEENPAAPIQATR